MPDKKEFIIFVLLSLIALGLGYWYGMPDKPSEERAEAGTPPAPTVVINVVTNVLKEVVTNIVAVNPQPTPAPVKPRPTPTPPAKPQPTPTNIVPASSQSAVEKAIRNELNKPTGELTKADLERVTTLNLFGNQLTEVKGLEKLTKLKRLHLIGNQLTEVPKGLENLTQLEKLVLSDNRLTKLPEGLEKLTQLKDLQLRGNPDLTKAQIDQLQKALPKCKIDNNAK